MKMHPHWTDRTLLLFHFSSNTLKYKAKVTEKDSLFKCSTECVCERQKYMERERESFDVKILALDKFVPTRPASGPCSTVQAMKNPSWCIVNECYNIQHCSLFYPEATVYCSNIYEHSRVYSSRCTLKFSHNSVLSCDPVGM